MRQHAPRHQRQSSEEKEIGKAQSERAITLCTRASYDVRARHTNSMLQASMATSTTEKEFLAPFEAALCSTPSQTTRATSRAVAGKARTPTLRRVRLMRWRLLWAGPPLSTASARGTRRRGSIPIWVPSSSTQRERYPTSAARRCQERRGRNRSYL